ncbi:lipid-binding SYLF domain-containing protein [Vibrio tapetis subsp. quintayensis]|uniref:lipid-binding SYLF domain-containing protein n=1 Tax=Vibrio tapetis TaxID=52443 RepID=UPI0025B2F264|nr:lipid-binding SYLF domain-containing protein [Vibrio tapetis]MDN3682820.1 lipid-binding SYLF domain-containing protein [Vibrio tapetis subsp. quintayensis]
MIRLLTTRILTIALVLTGGLLSKAVLAGDVHHQAFSLTERAQAQLEDFDDNERWNSVKNTVGSAKAILIMPDGGQLGYLLGTQWGKGIIMARKNQTWSAPLFVDMRSYMLGLVIGGQKVSGIGILLDDHYLDMLTSESMKISATGDLTLGRGVSGKVVAGTSGISTLMVSQNTGAYFGGSVDTFKIKPDTLLNQAIYGDQFTPRMILEKFEEQPLLPVQQIQTKLSQIAYDSVFSE